MKNQALGAAAERVAHAVLRSGPISAAELAAELELTPAGVRRQLDGLLDTGIVEAHERAPYGPRSASASGPRGRGRPARVYTVTQAGRDALEQVREDVGLEALRFIAATQGRAGVAAFAEARVARQVGRYEAQVAAAGPGERAVHALAEALTADGYEAEVLPAGPTGVQLCQRNCPVAHVAEEFDELCEAEARAFSELLGTHVTRLATLSHGDGLCTAHVLLGASGPAVAKKNGKGAKGKRSTDQRSRSLRSSA